MQPLILCMRDQNNKSLGIKLCRRNSEFKETLANYRGHWKESEGFLSNSSIARSCSEQKL